MTKTIIVVDDDKSILHIFRRILEKAGYSVDVAETAQEALTKLETRSYDLALIDNRLPDMEGITLLSHIQSTLPNMKRILMTGFPTPEDNVKALNRGADAYLIKPIKPDELIRIVNEMVSKQAESENINTPETSCGPSQSSPFTTSS